MSRQEAIEFYTRKQSRATAEDSKEAHSNILSLLNDWKDMRDVRRDVVAFAEYSRFPKRRRIYRLALQEMSR